MLAKLDPTAEPSSDPLHSLDPDLLPTYKSYKAIAARIPGNHNPQALLGYCYTDCGCVLPHQVDYIISMCMLHSHMEKAKLQQR